MSLGPAHRGYQYQDLLTAYRFAFSLTNDIESITVDKKFHDLDLFDDLTFQTNGRTLRRQIKSSQDENTYFEKKHLTTTYRDLEIDSLIKSVKGEGAAIADEYRLWATWKEPIDDLKDYLMPSTAASTFPGIQTKLFRLRTDQIWNEGQEPVWDRLKNSIEFTRQDFVDFAERFVIELEFPSFSTDLFLPGTLETLLLNLLINSVGIGRYPNHRQNPVDIAARLVQLANSARTQSKTVSREEIETTIHLQKDFGRVAQQFPIEKSIEVEGLNLQNTIEKNIGSQTVILTGTPGSGKSWALTEFAEKLKKENRLVARHYCYLEPGDPQVQRRITSDVLFGNLIYELIEANPELKNALSSAYAAGPRELEQLLERGFAEGIINECILIVDGVDHISRVFAEADDLTSQDVDIVEELAMLSLPEGVCLIVGSQPGAHLDPIRSNNSIDIGVPSWSLPEVTSLAAKIGVINELIKIGLSPDELLNFINQLLLRSEGNPLYATFLCKQIVRGLQNGEVVNPFDFLNTVPQLNGQISNYYQYLLDGLNQNPFGLILAELLGTVDFGLSENDIIEIYPQFVTYIPKTLNFLIPILLQISAQGGTRIYHESFRRFVNEKVKEKGGSITAILSPVINWLRNRDFFNDSKAYRFLLPCFRRAEQNREVLDIVNKSFVSDSLFAGQPQRAIEENIKLATYVARDILDWSAFVRLAELRRSSIVCFEQHLENIEKFGNTFATIFSPSQLNDRLLFEGKPTFPPHVGLLFCSLCDDAGEVAPWNEYLALKEPISQNLYGEYDASKPERDKINVDVARVHGLLRTLEIEAFFKRLVSYLEEDSSPSQKYFQPILARITQFGGTEVLKKLIDKVKMVNETKAIVLIELSKSYLGDGDLESAKSAANEAVKLTNSIGIAAEAFSLGADQAEVLKKLPDLSKLDIAVNGNNYISNDNQIKDWIIGIKIAAEIAPDLIQNEKLRFVANNWYRNWLRFVINLAEAEVEAKNNINSAQVNICKALEELASDTRPFVGKPRACDLYNIHSLISDTISRALALLRSVENWKIALAYLKKISIETTTYLQGSPSGPLTSERLIDLLSSYAGDENLTEPILDIVKQLIERTKKSVDYYVTQAHQEMSLAFILAKGSQREESVQIWKSATIRLSAYAFRKDRTIYELIYGVPNLKVLGGMEAPNSIKALQPLVNAVVQHTDGKETKYSPIAWISSLGEIDSPGAVIVLADSLVKYGGTIHWRYEDAFPDVIDHFYEQSDARLVNFLASTQPYVTGDDGGIKHIKQRLRLIKRIFDENAADGEQALLLLAAQVHGDPPDFDPSAYEVVKDFALQHNIELPQVNSVTEDYIKKEERSSNYGEEPFSQFKDKTVFPENADFSQILLYLREDQNKIFENRKKNEPFINAFGYRLIEMLEAGENQKVVQLLQYFARILYYGFIGASPLAELAEGLERYGYAKEASIAFSLAYARSRGGGGYLALGDKEHLKWIERSFVLSADDGERTLADEVVYWLNDQHHIVGVTQHLIEFCAEYKPEILKDVWQSVFDVIEHRLPDNDKDSGIFSNYNPSDAAFWTPEEAIIMLLLARVSHPEFYRKRAALAGVASVISRLPEQVITPLKQFLAVNTPISSILLVLHVLIESEPAPYLISTSITEELKNLSRSNIFAFQVLARTLLERLGIFPDQEVFDISGLRKSPTPTDSKLRAILSLDWENRIEAVSEIWAEFPVLLAERFDYIWETNEGIQERSKSRLEAAYNSSYENLPPTSMISWAEETFEFVFQEVLAGIFTKITDEEEIAFVKNVIGSKVLSAVHLQIANYHSRVPRPPLVLPSKQVSSLETVEPLTESGQYNGWYRCGYFEDELLINEETRGFNGVLRIMEGIEFHADFSLISLHPPFAQTNGDYWWGTGEWQINPAEFNGPITGLDLRKDLLGMLPMLVLHPAISTALNLESQTSWQSQLVLYDAQGDVAVRFRCWHVGPIGSSIDLENVRLEGCDLIVRPDVFENLVKQIGKPYRIIRIVLPDKT